MKRKILLINIYGKMSVINNKGLKIGKLSSKI